MGLLIDNFGDAVARRGRLRTKYVKPIYEDDAITSCARVTGIENGVYAFEVWCENDKGEKVTAGEALVMP